MARSLVELQQILAGIPGVTAAYIQDPGDGSLAPPYIMIDESAPNDVKYADNVIYSKYKGYQVTVVLRNPLSEIPDLVEALPHARFDRKFRTDGLHHYTYNLFF